MPAMPNFWYPRRCEAVQNLRKAVATYKVQWESAPPGSAKQEKIAHIAFNYLFRYVTKQTSRDKVF